MKANHRKQFNDINITPLTDIFLVLLIMMMVIAPMLDAQGLKMSVPTVGESTETDQEPKTLQVVISESGTYTINDQPVEAAQLKQVIREQKAQYPDGVVIETHPKTTHGAMVAAMDAARGAGVEKLAVSQIND